MWREYAVEPECLVQSRDGFRALFFSFGWEHGRLLALYPKKDWLRMVHAALSQSPLRDVERIWVEENLKNERHRFVRARQPYSAEITWLENAEAQRGDNRFDGIVARDNPRSHQAVILSHDAGDTTPLFCCPGDLHVPRRSAEMAASVQLLLRRADAVRFIDPHFGGLEERFLRVLRAMLQFVTPGHDQPRRLEYHLARKSLDLDRDEFERRLRKKLHAAIPPQSVLKFLLWEKRPGGEMLHDRYVLSERGGVDFSVGLDEGEPGQHTKVSRLDRSAYERVWRDYSIETAAFDLIDSFELLP